MTTVTLRMPDAAHNDLFLSGPVAEAGYLISEGFASGSTGWTSFRVECPKAPADNMALARTLGRLAGWKSRHLS